MESFNLDGVNTEVLERLYHDFLNIASHLSSDIYALNRHINDFQKLNYLKQNIYSFAETCTKAKDIMADIYFWSGQPDQTDTAPKFQSLKNLLSDLSIEFEVFKNLETERNKRLEGLIAAIEGSLLNFFEIFSLLTNFSKADSGEINLADIVGTLIKVMRDTSFRREIKISLNAMDINISVFGKKSNLVAVLFYLLDNSFDSFSEHSVKNPTINIDIAKDGRNITISVKDNGRGIARKSYERIFNPGYSTKRGSAGMGLSFSKYVIEEEFGGHLTFHSSINEETIFTFSFNQPGNA